MIKTTLSILLLMCAIPSQAEELMDEKQPGDLAEWENENVNGGNSWRERWPEVEPLVRTTITADLHMVQGVGGNVAILTGPEGTLLVDSGHFRVLESRLFPIIEEVSKDTPVRYIINTHGHGDHGAGNTYFIEKGAIAISHVITREEYANLPPHYPSLPEHGLPQITIENNMTLHFNQQTIKIAVVPAGHTKGDIVVYFEKQNIVHTGDVFFDGAFVPLAPQYMDPKGTTMGLIEAQKMTLSLGDENTRYITGHNTKGPGVATRSDIERDHAVLVEVVKNIRFGIEAGKTLEEIKASQPTRKFDDTHVWPGMMPARTVELLYYGLVGSPPPSKERQFK